MKKHFKGVAMIAFGTEKKDVPIMKNCVPNVGMKKCELIDNYL